MYGPEFESPGLLSPCPGGSGRDRGIPPRKLASDALHL